MKLLNKKMLVAPILAVALVLSIAAAVSYLPVSPQAGPVSQPSPEPTPAIYWNFTPAAPTSSPGSYNMRTQTAAPGSTSQPATPEPTAVPASLSTSINYLPVLSVIAAIAIGVVAALVLFSEKSLKKELSKEN